MKKGLLIDGDTNIYNNNYKRCFQAKMGEEEYESESEYGGENDNISIIKLEEEYNDKKKTA